MKLGHNPCFSGNSFATQIVLKDIEIEAIVTILVLVETLLQLELVQFLVNCFNSHNPCFSGNSFATRFRDIITLIQNGHNPCFSGNSFATI